jgi:hypothetical protein
MKLGAPFCLSLSSKAAGGRCLFDKVRKVVGRSAGGGSCRQLAGRLSASCTQIYAAYVVGLALAPAAAHSLCNYDARRVLFICAVLPLPSTTSLLDQGLVNIIEKEMNLDDR